MNFRCLRERGKALHRYPLLSLFVFPLDEAHCYYRRECFAAVLELLRRAAMHVLERFLRS